MSAHIFMKKNIDQLNNRWQFQPLHFNSVDYLYAYINKD